MVVTILCTTDQSSCISLEMGPTTFYCPTCQLPFNGMDTLRMHMDLHTSDPEHFDNQCPTCGNFFESRDVLNMHMEGHRISYGNSYLNESLNMETRDSFEQTFSCRLCQSPFHSKETLRMHIDEHKFTQKCDRCNIAFKSDKNLMKHKRMCTAKMNEIDDTNWLELTKGMDEMIRGAEEMAKDMYVVEEVAKDMFVVEEREADRSKIRKRGSRGGQWKRAFRASGINK